MTLCFRCVYSSSSSSSPSTSACDHCSRVDHHHHQLSNYIYTLCKSYRHNDGKHCSTVPQDDAPPRSTLRFGIFVLLLLSCCCCLQRFRERKRKKRHDTSGRRGRERERERGRWRTRLIGVPRLCVCVCVHRRTGRCCGRDPPRLRCNSSLSMLTISSSVH